MMHIAAVTSLVTIVLIIVAAGVPNWTVITVDNSYNYGFRTVKIGPFTRCFGSLCTNQSPGNFFLKPKN